jgi:hypothetical protein
MSRAERKTAAVSAKFARQAGAREGNAPIIRYGDCTVDEALGDVGAG